MIWESGIYKGHYGIWLVQPKYSEYGFACYGTHDSDKSLRHVEKPHFDVYIVDQNDTNP